MNRLSASLLYCTNRLDHRRSDSRNICDRYRDNSTLPFLDRMRIVLELGHQTISAEQDIRIAVVNRKTC